VADKAIPPVPCPPVALGAVLKREHKEIMEVRKKRLVNFDWGCKRPPAVAPVPSVPEGAPAPEELPNLQKNDPAWAEVIKEAHEANFVGLAFSGGGIRSATFNLGVLQALADLKLLCRIDYLSTVSGGGYIGSWLIAWTQRLGSFAKVQARISTHRVHLEDDKEQPPVRFLRVFSNYLTPKLGFFSGDTWAMISIYLRNLLLNQTIVLALVATLLLAPRLVIRWANAALSLPRIGYDLMGTAAVVLPIAFFMIQVNMGYLNVRQVKPAPRLTEQKWTLLLVSAPLFAAAFVAALWLNVIGEWGSAYQRLPYKDAIWWLTAHQSCPIAKLVLRLISHELFSYQNAVLLGAIAYSAIWGLASLGEKLWTKWIAGWVKWLAAKIAKRNAEDAKAKKQEQSGATSSTEGTATTPLPHPHRKYEWPIQGAAAVCAGALAGWLFALIAGLALFQDKTAALPVTVGVPLVVAAFLLAEVLQLGLMGIVFRDWKREWRGRLAGWLLLFAITWLTVFWLAQFFPEFVRSHTAVWSAWKAWALKSLTLTWVLSTIGTVMAGNSKASGNPGALSWKDAAIKVGPYVFMAGLLCWTSWGIDCFLKVYNHLYWTILTCGVIAVVMAWRVDINEFSMHMFYRNRLVSCYLGASHKKRSPNRFTGFDPEDDLPLKSFTYDAEDSQGEACPYDGPYPLLNASLNLVKGKDLAWQERKAESFVMTPHFCGFDVWLEEQDSPMLTHDHPWPDKKIMQEGSVSKTEASNRPATPVSVAAEASAASTEKSGNKLEQYGYRATEDYAFPSPMFHGLNLGLAMAISGAAASPNMGFYSSAPVAFLMTVFNVRLGQWLGNPRRRISSRRATPRVGLGWLINELLGGTNDESSYVYLSDGGHFENMGVYELVKRRCGLIIVCDAEADENYKFCGLGNAIRKCRIDLGIDIELDTNEIAPKKAGGPGKQHCVVGQIHYENADQAAPMGKIIYFKASLTGDEPADVRNYKKEHASFPHESTADQWFSESQFESYRELGYHEVYSSIKGTPPEKSILPAPPKPLERELQEILKEFRFEVEDSNQAAGGVQKAVSGTDVPAPASTASPGPGSTVQAK